MFVEEKEVGEVRTTAETRPSDLIRRGHSMIEEHRFSHYFCAMGAMWRGSGRSDDELARLITDGDGNYAVRMGAVLGLPEHMALQVEYLHLTKHTPRLVIADWLESQGY